MVMQGNPGDIVLNNLRLRLSQLEDAARVAAAQQQQAHQGSPTGKGGEIAEASGADHATIVPLNLEERLARIQNEFNAKPSLAGPAAECAKKLLFITKERKAWLQTGNAAGIDVDAMLDPDAPAASASSASSKLHSQPHKPHELGQLLHYAREEYLRDLSTLRAFALSKDGSEQVTQWRAMLPHVAASLSTQRGVDLYDFSSSHQSAAGTSPPTQPAAGDGVPQKEHASAFQVLEHTVTFQVNGQTKSLDDLAQLMHANAARTARLEARWERLHATFQATVEWANRSLCEVDLALEVAEAQQS